MHHRATDEIVRPTTPHRGARMQPTGIPAKDHKRPRSQIDLKQLLAATDSVGPSPTLAPAAMAFMGPGAPVRDGAASGHAGALSAGSHRSVAMV
jgi:hypothetical protein